MTNSYTVVSCVKGGCIIGGVITLIWILTKVGHEYVISIEVVQKRVHWLAFVNMMLKLWILVKKDYHAVSYRPQVYSRLGHVLLGGNYVCTQHTSCGACEGIRMCRDACSIHILVVLWQINAHCTSRPSLYLSKALGYNNVRGWLCPLWPWWWGEKFFTQNSNVAFFKTCPTDIRLLQESSQTSYGKSIHCYPELHRLIQMF